MLEEKLSLDCPCHFLNCCSAPSSWAGPRWLWIGGRWRRGESHTQKLITQDPFCTSQPFQYAEGHPTLCSRPAVDPPGRAEMWGCDAPKRPPSLVWYPLWEAFL